KSSKVGNIAGCFVEQGMVKRNAQIRLVRDGIILWQGPMDSLKRFSNVCNGCFKTIYTLSVNLARERGIRYIFTGLSRGQIFETRVADQFQQRIFDPALIDRNIIEARKAYHRADDAVSRHLDVSAFTTDDVFDDVHFVDFYRYTDVSLDEMYNYLGHRIKWVRPADTGRSTNCLINEAGIYVHKAERGFHNYSLPYSWDVRLGHKQRDAARDELDDRINVDNVRSILEQIGYDMPDASAEFGARRRLIGYYVAAEDIDTATLRSALGSTLPQAVIPSQFVRLDDMPLTQNGKVDRRALPDPNDLRPDLGVAYEAPDGVVERKLAAIWQQVLGVDRVGANDNFFDLGGDSILNIQIVGRARKHGLTLKPQQIFEHATVRELASVVGDTEHILSEQGPITGDVPLNPVQQRFFERCADAPEHVLNHYNQNVLLSATGQINALMLEEALRHTVRHHDALRARYDNSSGPWTQTLLDTGDALPSIETIDFSDLPAARHGSKLRAVRERLNAALSIRDGRLMAAALIERGHGLAPWLFMTVHHLAIDGVSWWVLLEDLQSAYGQLRDGHAVSLPPKTTSARRFVEALTDYANADPERWTRTRPNATPTVALPTDRTVTDGVRAGDLGTCEVTLSRDLTTGLLVDTATAWRAQAPDVLLGALSRTLCTWLGATNVAVDMEHHGRESVAADVDVLRTVGWFTSICPVDLGAASDAPAEWVRDAKTTLRALPDNGLAYGAARYLGNDAALAAEATGTLQFNYLGQWDRARAGGHWFSFAEPLSLSEAPDAPREHALALDIMAFDGQLTLTFSYCTRRFDRDTIERLAEAYRTSLSAIVEAVRGGENAALAATDFPTADLSQSDLDALLDDFGDDL
ncbi:MAG: condensation domain-containing protein, partial [Pseudomonadota bacterium]